MSADSQRAMAALSIVDAHHHVWDLAVRDQPWIAGRSMAPIRRSFSVDDLRPSAQATGVTVMPGRRWVQVAPPSALMA